MNLINLKKQLLTLAQELILSLPLKWEEKLTLILPIRKLRQNSKNSSEQKNNTERTCSKCGETKPLDKNHYQSVKYFKQKFSHYCNECDKPKPREE